jgi:hypothetical protein
VLLQQFWLQGYYNVDNICWFQVIEKDFLLQYTCILVCFFRDMVEHTFQQPQHIHALEMAMQWLPGPGFHLRLAVIPIPELSKYKNFRIRYSFSSPFILLQDLEFVQFHPTGIYGAGCLITEGCYFLLLTWKICCILFFFFSTCYEYSMITFSNNLILILVCFKLNNACFLILSATCRISW